MNSLSKLRWPVVLGSTFIVGLTWFSCYMIRISNQPPVGSWWIIIFILVFFGGLGGIIRYTMTLYPPAVENSKQDIFCSKRASQSAIVGAVAGLVVPLFLNASASSLIETVIRKLPDGDVAANQGLFFLIGYCILAGILGGQFLTSMAAKMIEELRESQRQMQQTASDVKNMAEAAQRALRTEGRLESLEKGILASKSEEFSEAERIFRLHIKQWPDDPEGYMWLAYACKRTGGASIGDIIAWTETAIALKKTNPPAMHSGTYYGPVKWVSNLACYYAVDGRDSSKILNILRNIFISAKENRKISHIRNLQNTLTTDQDLNSIRRDSGYTELVNEVKQFLEQVGKKESPMISSDQEPR